MTTKKKVTYTIAAIAVILIGAAGTLLAMSLINPKENGTNKQENRPESSYDSSSTSDMDKGYAAESKGDNKKALKHYTDAHKACKDDDDLCKVNTKNKMQLLDVAINGKNSKNTAPPEAPEGAPVAVPSPSPKPRTLPPAPVIQSEIRKAQPAEEKSTKED